MTQDSLDWYDRLSPKEREVLEAYAREHSYEAVARALRKTESVVDQQLLSARRKMGVCSTAEAMFKLAERKATRLGASENGAEMESQGSRAKSDQRDPEPAQQGGSIIL